MEDLTGKQLGSYQVIAPLGEGGMAAVYKAYQPAMDRHVALKILPRHIASDPQFVSRFQQEARVLARLRHPHILPVFAFGEADGYTYIVTPFIQSGTLTGLIAGNPLPWPQIRAIISQVGDALDYAHAQGLIHRDVKPSNVRINERGDCLLTDFGLAKIVEGSIHLTTSGAIMGTPAYMSPEEGLGQKLDARSDIYSLGVILYEMATGRAPYSAETPMAVVIKHINDPLPTPTAVNPAIPEAVERVILKALAKRPEDRYATAGDLVRALEAVTAGLALTPAKVYRERVLDAAIARRVPVHKPTELIALVRRKESDGLRAVLEIDQAHIPSKEDIRSKPFSLEFPIGSDGRPGPVDLILKVDSPDFEPKSREKRISIPPDRDSETCIFLLTPQHTGDLLINLELYKKDLTHVAAGILRTNGEASDRDVLTTSKSVVSIPLFIFSYNFYQSGGVNITTPGSGDLTIGGDVVGRDKITQVVEPPKSPDPHQLPPPPPDFTGREVELRELLAAAKTHSIIGLYGLGGVGKTALALKLADQLAPSYYDAQFYVDLQSAGPKPLTLTEAMLRIVRACYPNYQQPESLAELRGAYYSALHEKHALVLFDNADGITYLGQLLLPAGCLLIWTARQRLDVAGQFRLGLQPLSPIDAQRLLVATTPWLDPQAYEVIARLCGYLPLALKAAGSMLAVTEDLDPARYAAQLQDERNRLEKLPGGNDLDVAASFNTSYALLPPETARVFRWLSVFEGPFEAALEEDVCADPGHTSLSALVRRSLVEYDRAREEYYLHDLMRLFAARRLAEAGAEEHANFETHFLRALGDPARQRERAMFAGRTLLHLGWKPAKMRTPVLQALARLMRDPAAGGEVERRAAALLLTRLQWLDDVRITADEMLAYLELIARYVDSRADRQYLERHITLMLNDPPDVLSEAQQAHLLARRAPLRGKLGRLKEAEEDYRQAAGWIDKIGNGAPLSEDLIHLLARVKLGMGNIVVQQTEPDEPTALARYEAEWRRAIELYRSASELAQTYSRDTLLEVGIERGLNYAHTLLMEWDEAERYYRDTLSTLMQEQERLDIYTFTWWYARTLEAASDMHLRKGKWCASRQDNDQALAEFRMAYCFALSEITHLRRFFGNRGAPSLAYAHINAGDSLRGIQACQSGRAAHPVHRPDAKACAHWRRAQEIALHLDIAEMADEAKERLKQHCQ